MRASKRRSSRRRTSRRLYRNDAAPVAVAAKPSNKKKLLLGGIGVVVVGGAAAYMLTRPAAPPPPPPLPPGADGPTAAQCNALQASLSQLLAGPTPDAGEVSRRRAAIAQCIAAVRAAGGDIDNAVSNLSAGDTSAQYADAKFNDYRATGDGAYVERNNKRQDVLNSGASAASSYAAAAAAAADPATARGVRQSILQALDQAIVRKICYLYGGQGCGRANDISEAHGNDKAADEYTKVIRPLLDAHGVVVRKVGPTAAEDDAKYFATLMREATAANDYTIAKYNEYKSIDYSDSLRRNNLRQEVLRAERTMAAAVTDIVGAAISYQNMPALRAAAAFILIALAAANVRWLCFFFGQNGCGRLDDGARAALLALSAGGALMVPVEDHGNDKAGQEYATAIAPLSAAYIQAATSLVRSGADPQAFLPLIQIKLQRLTPLSAIANAKFGEYQSIQITRLPTGDMKSDPLRAGILLGEVNFFGGQLASGMKDAMDAALAGAVEKPRVAGPAWGASTLLSAPPAATSGLGAVLNVGLMRPGPSVLAPMMLTVPLPSAAPTTGMIDASGRPYNAADPAAYARGYDDGRAHRYAASDLATMPTGTKNSYLIGYAVGMKNLQLAARAAGPSPVVQSARDAGEKSVRSVLVAAGTALDASTARQLCLLLGGDGCPRDGDAAVRENGATTAPLMSVVEQGANFFTQHGDPKGEEPLIKAKLKICSALSAFVNAKFAEFRAYDWGNPLQRNNTRDDMYRVAQRMIQCLRDTNPKTDAGRALVKPVVDAAWQASIDRMNCYLDRASNCGRGALAMEPTNEEKGDNEHAAVFVPLGDIKTRLAGGQALSGMFDTEVAGLPVGAWLGAAALVGGMWWLSTSRKTVRNRRRRRSSYRAVA